MKTHIFYYYFKTTCVALYLKYNFSFFHRDFRKKLHVSFFISHEKHYILSFA